MMNNPTVENIFHSFADSAILRISFAGMFGENLPGSQIVDEIEMQCGGMEVIYNSAVRFAIALKSWCGVNVPKWEKLKRSTEFDYDPICNYDRTEEITDERIEENVNTGYGVSTGKSGGNNSGNRAGNVSGESSGNDSGNRSGNVVNKVSAYNSTTMVDKDGNTTTENSTNERAENYTSESGENYNSEHSETLRNETFSDSNGTTASVNKHTAKIKGNVGVTTSQQMIEEERNVVRYVYINEIVEDFKRRFCLLCYDV